MEKKPDWKEQIGKNLQPILAIFAFVSGIAAFIIAIRQDFYLYATIIGLLLLLGLVSVGLYLLLARKKPAQEGQPAELRYPKLRWVGLTAISSSLLLVVILLSVNTSRNFVVAGLRGTPTPTYTPTPTPTITPTPTPTPIVLPKADVLITELDNRSASRRVEVARRLEEDLRAQLRKYDLQDVQVKVISQPVTNLDEAQAMANQAGSKVIVWGWYDDLGIRVRIFLSGGDLPGTEIPGSREIPLMVSDSSGDELSFVLQDVLPENVSFLSLFVIGHLKHLSNQYLQGRRAFDAAMQSIPDTVEIENEALLHFFIARRLFEEASPNTGEIICEYTKAIHLDPSFAEAYNNLGVVLLQRFTNQAEMHMEGGSCLEAENLSAGTLFDLAMEIQPDWVLPVYNRWVAAYMRPEWIAPTFYGDTRTIESELETVIRRDPSLTEARSVLAEIAFLNGSYQRAANWLKPLDENGQASAHLTFNLGQLSLLLDDRTEATEFFDKVLRIRPDDPEAHLALAGLALEEGDDAAARQHLEAIPLSSADGVDLTPETDLQVPTGGSPEAAAEILRSLLAYRSSQPEQAIAALERSLEAHYSLAVQEYERYLLGLLYLAQGDQEQAQRWWSDLAIYPYGMPNLFMERNLVNATAQLASYDLANLCQGTGVDVNLWGNEETDPCLPADLPARLEVVYQAFIDHLPGRWRLLDVREVPKGAACPYVYTYEYAVGDWAFDTTILYELVGPANEILQRRPLLRFDGRLLIREVEPEISYLDQLYVEVLDGNGHLIRIYPTVADLQQADGRYIVLHQGQNLGLHFPDYANITSPGRAWVIAKGYYHPIQP